MGTGAAGCRLPTKPLFSQLSDWAESRAARPGSTAFSGEKGAGWRGDIPHFKAIRTWIRFNPNFRPSLLKWLNSLYRPAGPEGIRGKASPAAFRTAIGASPSGKAVDFDSTMRRFESSRPSQHSANWIVLIFIVTAVSEFSNGRLGGVGLTLRTHSRRVRNIATAAERVRRSRETSVLRRLSRTVPHSRLSTRSPAAGRVVQAGGELLSSCARPFSNGRTLRLQPLVILV